MATYHGTFTAKAMVKTPRSVITMSTTPAPVSVTTSTADTTPPSVPTGLSATAAGSTTVNLAWNASTDNVGVTGYTVYRNGAVLATVGASTLGYSDAAVAQATTYTYSIDAFDAAGNHSAQSATASVHVPGVPKFVHQHREEHQQHE